MGLPEWSPIQSVIAFDELRSTKWNASLILLRDYAELVSLCKVIVWKTHIPVRTQKWPPLLIFWQGYVTA